jgi:endonuclease III
MASAKDKETAGNKTLGVLDKFRKAKRGVSPLPPLELIIFSLLRGENDDRDVFEALKRVRAEFVDWNEARVARRSELAALLDPLSSADELAARMQAFLNQLFDVCGGINLGFLETVKPSEAKRHVLELDAEISRDVVALVLFQLCPGTTMPLGAEALKLARKLGLVGRSGTRQQLQKRLQEELSPAEAAELLQYLELETAPPAPKKKSSSRRKK